MAQWLLPMAAPGECLREHGLCIGQDGRIKAIDARARLLESYPEAERIDLGKRALLPGLVNSHCHAAMSLMRGLANDMPLDSWLRTAIWPTEGRWLSADFVRDGTELAIAEMLSSGTSCFNDMYLFPEAAAEAVDRLGCRALIGLPLIDAPTPWAQGIDESLDKSRRLIERWRGHARIGFVLSPHAPYTVSDESFAKILRWHEAVDAQMPIQIHLHESHGEIEASLGECGLRPIERLAKIGLCERRLLAIHMVHCSDSDIETCQRHGVSIAHCPQSNAHFANGICPVGRLRRAGLKVGLGTDGAASNNDLDLYDEMGFAALIAKLGSGDAAAMSAGEALALASINSAEALRLERDIGSLEVGKLADIQAIELSGWPSQPMLDLARLLVYARRAFTVSDIWVAGEPLMRDGRLLGIDAEDLGRRTAQWGKSILGRNEGTARQYA